MEVGLEFGKIEPFVRRTLQATIIEVEAVNINVGLCHEGRSFADQPLV